MSSCLLLLLLRLLVACKQPEANPALPSADAPDRPYQPPAAGTVKDPSTHLFWQRCAVGQDEKSCEGTPKLLYAEDAEAQCAALQLANYAWRLPTADELLTLVVCPDGNLPSLEKGCAEPNYHANYNPVWFPNEGDAATYWTSSSADADHLLALSLNSGKGTPASLVRDQQRLRCVSDGKPFVAKALTVQETLPNVRIIAKPGAPVWAEASISAASVGALVAGQLVTAGEPGPLVTWQGKEAHFVKVQGLPWSGWTVDLLLEAVPPSGVLEAIDADFALPPGVPTGEAAMGLLPERERLVPGEQYRLANLGNGTVTVVLQGSPQVKLGEAKASAFRWVEPEEFVCTRRMANFAGAPAGLRDLWPRDAQACEHYEVVQVDPIFPGSNNVWRLRGEEGGFDGYFVDSEAVAMDGRPARKLANTIVAIGGEGDPEGDRCHCLKVMALQVQKGGVIFEKTWDPSDPQSVRWTVGTDGGWTGSDGTRCRAVDQQAVCTHD